MYKFHIPISEITTPPYPLGCPGKVDDETGKKAHLFGKRRSSILRPYRILIFKIQATTILFAYKNKNFSRKAKQGQTNVPYVLTTLN